MKKAVLLLLAVMLLLGLPVTAAGASNLTVEQKFDALKQKGIFAGFSDGSSRLYQSMTREEFAQVLFKLFELPDATGSPSYVDVIKTRWSFKPVEAVTKAGLMFGVGNKRFEPRSPVTVEQLAAILIRGYEFGGQGAAVNGKVSKWAKASVGIALQKNLIPALNDYTQPATRGLLVEATYAVYEQTSQEPLHVKSVDAVSNQIVRVNLLQPASSADKERFSLKDVLGVSVNIQQTTLNGDGMSVTVVTDRQVANRSHTLYVDGVPYTYVAPSDDTVKPTVVSFTRQSNSVIEVVFSEPVDRSSATNSSNYSFDNGLKMTTLQMSDDNRKATITTSRQNDGTTYRIWIKNVKDQAGNTMDEWSTTFYVDDSKPKITSLDRDDSTARIKITFSEKINPDRAENTGYYTIDKGLSVKRADLAGDGKTVWLTTSAQQDATVYTITISGIRDLQGHTMDTESFVFAGIANPISSVRLDSITAVNKNTLEITFSRAVSDNDVSKLAVSILSDNNNKGFSMKGWISFNMRKTGSDRTVVVQYRNSDPHPEFFMPGHVYVARITGVANLASANDADQEAFAGTSVSNPAPVVTQVVALNKTSVKIVFSEPVKNVTEKAFRIWDRDGDPVAIRDDTLNRPNAIVTEVVLELKDGLTKDDAYAMTFRSGIITEAAGWNGLQTQIGSDDIRIAFRGV